MKSQTAELAVLALRRAGGYACSINYGLVEIGGRDAARFLQSRTTNDVAGLESGRGQESSLLDRKAHLEAYFSLHRLGDTYWIVAEREQIATIIEQLDKFVFNEKVENIDRSSQGRFAAVQGFLGKKLLSEASNLTLLPVSSEQDIARMEIWGHPLVLIKRSITGEEGYLLWTEAALADDVNERLSRAAAQLDLSPLSEQAWNIARIEAGIPRYGDDMSLENLLPETGLEDRAVSYNKGCYLGQEVIARIKTFGAPRRGLTGLFFSEGERMTFPLRSTILVDGKEIGALASNVYSPTLKRTVAYAYLNKEHRVPGDRVSVEIGGGTYAVTVTLLPFYQPPSIEERARTLYEEALSEFATGDETRAIALLRDALALHPLFGDCYEALGVILSKHDQLDEAVNLMKKLSELDPDSVMAHANLSVFYMQQGNKDAAEEEKALAMSIRMRQVAREADKEKQQEESEQQKREVAIARMEMFKQVLEIDSEDLLANYGLGSIHVELEEYEQSVPYLCKAIQVKPTHSVAYVALGAAYQGLEQIDQAVETYKQGIEVAAKRGDMTPLKEMQTRLAQIEHGVAG